MKIGTEAAVTSLDRHLTAARAAQLDHQALLGWPTALEAGVVRLVPGGECGAAQVPAVTGLLVAEMLRARGSLPAAVTQGAGWGLPHQRTSCGHGGAARDRARGQARRRADVAATVGRTGRPGAVGGAAASVRCPPPQVFASLRLTLGAARDVARTSKL
ncbi:hypothetical protein UK23_14730 [Lentzea aerocolonigenes]|uniref:Uncharacterized protein n=1 Tax=Lentzea aerocolonigenes TaxID=68170 RepID=A0A0F0H4I8_LENAE|nr:hypothetical protein [Lentzea aerocolonigenes]KJK49232.1 hypothetical protein UK23_14730 [Lentzea aerocolonigenes]